MIDFNTYKTGVDNQNASLNEGHKFVQLFELGGFSSVLRAEHPIQGVEKSIYEFTIPEALRFSGKAADPFSFKGKKQISDAENAQDQTDSEKANSVAVAGWDLGVSLTSEGLPQGFPVYLF